MERLSPAMKPSRRPLVAGVWSLLIVLMGFDFSRFPFWASLGIVFLISIVSSCSLLLIKESSFFPRGGSRWNSKIPVLIAFLIPLAWSMNLCDWTSPALTALLASTAVVPVGIVWLLAFPAEFKSHTEQTDHQTLCRRCLGPSQTVEIEDESTEDELQSVSAIRLAEIDDETFKKTSNRESLPSEVTQWLKRSQTAAGDIIEGGFRIEFHGSQRDRTIHVSFCPPFSQTPKISTTDLDDANLEIQVAATFPFGARFVIRRAGVMRSNDAPNSVQICRIGFVAEATAIKKAA